MLKKILFIMLLISGLVCLQLSVSNVYSTEDNSSIFIVSDDYEDDSDDEDEPDYGDYQDDSDEEDEEDSEEDNSDYDFITT